MIRVKIVADSVAPSNIRLTTFELIYPRFIHAELMTHRAFSRNAASSRAIPVKKLLKRARKDMAMPEHWGINRPGMQATEEASKGRAFIGRLLWKLAGYSTLVFAWLLMKLNFHKQLVNRIIEPWSHITVIMTADQIGLANMWAQRDHHDAQPEFRILARKMWVAYNMSLPRKLGPGEWHMPYIYDVDRIEVERQWISEQIEILKKVSVGRCARVSYLNHDGARNLKDDIKLHDRLLGQNPGHWSPLEHVAQAASLLCQSGNINGWIQYRKMHPQEINTQLKAWDSSCYQAELEEYFATTVRV